MSNIFSVRKYINSFNITNNEIQILQKLIKNQTKLMIYHQIYKLPKTIILSNNFIKNSFKRLIEYKKKIFCSWSQYNSFIKIKFGFKINIFELYCYYIRKFCQRNQIGR